jgi:glycosyltransferase involved in cell wall biosynthesis
MTGQAMGISGRLSMIETGRQLRTPASLRPMHGQVSAAGPAPIEVVLCAYNGDKYIRQQVESILGQSLKPARLSIYDDGSADGTMQVVEEIARNNDSGVEMILHRNARNLGYVRNFEQAIRNATLEFIALCDQDDVWERDKLEVLFAEFDDHTGVVFSDALLVDHRAASLDHTLWQAIRLTRKRQASFRNPPEARRLLLQQSFVTGAALIMRRSLAARIPPFPAAAPHDYWIAIVASELSVLKPVDRVLYKYRQHPENAMGQGEWSIARRALKLLRMAEARYADELHTYEQIAQALEGRAELEPARERFRAKAEFLRERHDAVQSGVRGLPRLLHMLVRREYRRFCRVAEAMFVLDAWMALSGTVRSARPGPA